MNAPAVFGSQALLTFTQFKLSALRIIQLVLKSQRAGLTCLPHGLGLSERNYRYLKNLALDSDILLLLKQQNHNEDVRQQLLEMRQDEWQEVRRLLLLNRAGYSDYEEALAEIVAAACLGGDHLWRDLGLPERAELSDLLHTHFPMLAKRNTQDMKWKKFFYKQLCEQEGGYVCRAPSCDQCAAFDDCFGPEE
ncbi:MAG: nitrogen fixation protein NifQ [Pseudomonadales bacterium]|nr:nitrogen fixation protein NifQ [Pseudomonadales bacterium]